MHTYMHINEQFHRLPPPPSRRTFPMKPRGFEAHSSSRWQKVSNQPNFPSVLFLEKQFYMRFNRRKFTFFDFFWYFTPNDSRIIYEKFTNFSQLYAGIYTYSLSTSHPTIGMEKIKILLIEDTMYSEHYLKKIG